MEFNFMRYKLRGLVFLFYFIYLVFTLTIGILIHMNGGVGGIPNSFTCEAA